MTDSPTLNSLYYPVTGRPAPAGHAYGHGYGNGLTDFAGTAGFVSSPPMQSVICGILVNLCNPCSRTSGCGEGASAPEPVSGLVMGVA